MTQPLNPRTRDQDERAEARRLVKECQAHPDEPQLWLRTALLLDSLDREATAIAHYEHALKLGLALADERTALICLASSHRNLRHPDTALAILRKARRRFPGDAAVEAFYALALLDTGDPRAAVRVLGVALVATAGAEGLQGFDQALLSKFRGVTRRSGGRRADAPARQPDRSSLR